MSDRNEDKARNRNRDRDRGRNRVGDRDRRGVVLEHGKIWIEACGVYVHVMGPSCLEGC